jgi:hypothetical protein
MKAALALVTAIGLTAGAPAPAHAEVDPVAQWNIVTVEAGRGRPPTDQIRALALAHAAMFDAANGVDRAFAPYLADLRPDGALSGPAAVVAAAHAVLVDLYPEKRATLDAALEASVASLPPGAERESARAFGRRIAETVLARRKDDGAAHTRGYQPLERPGVWRPTPPGHLPALGPHWGEVRPFLIADPAPLAPPAPPSLPSARYARDFAEVKAIGAKASPRRSADQTAAAAFWTAYPTVLWSSAARQASVRRPGLSLVERARVFALMSGAMADASVVGWAAKFRYSTWRPVTGIRVAASDGNDATEADPGWEPLIVTPPFPCYVSGHAITAGAAERTLALVLGDDRFDLEISNPEVGLTRRYAGFAQIAAEAREVRIWSGVHFRVSQEEGLRAGRRIGETAVATRLRPLAVSQRTLR